MKKIILFFCMLLGIWSKCGIKNSLTDQQNTKLSKYISARQTQNSQEPQIIQTYINLNRKLNNYLIQIDTGAYSFGINDSEGCYTNLDYLTFNSLDDVWICFQNPITILKCNKQWELKIGCGTFLQLHLPYNTDVIYFRSLDTNDDLRAINMPLVNVCAGTYHLWFVYSTRIGKVIKNVKPLFVTNPDCPC